MQRLQIIHRTEYRFPVAVRLGPHRLMLRPREGREIHIEAARLDIEPQPLLRWCRDANDNAVAIATFNEASSQLTVSSEVLITHFDDAPLDFLVEDYAVQHPFIYPAEERPDLDALCAPVFADEQPQVREWLRGLGLGLAPMETYVLLDRLNRAIRDSFEYGVREEPGVQSPATTLALGAGSCRDYATLFIESCRALGLASRFVSGYLHTAETERGHASTHAWAEVYLPGPGWKGFDQTGGSVVGSDHIAVAVARHPQAVPPIAGSFFGPAETVPQMLVDVRVAAL
ncbi:transglutaminase family protein [Plasticicumulans acidivorans]|uniref:Transglutaminase-like putative cysteine protease n=1 Tax=Plasticicumulans acidivorans TaxID=886464 RepID=A0A317N0G3_9GAMM|nr:transglutaminase family protein [Plasticicumulans acidivorans]PWV65604.1 transglutaminase-like putative cysteine protease [Plasticicumulans acidivorans]